MEEFMKYFKSITIISIIMTIIMYLSVFSYANTTYVWSNNANSILDTKDNNTSNSSKETTTEPENTNTNILNLESESAILIEQTTGQILYEHNSHEKLRPASVTKIMSILLIMEQIKSRKT